MRACLLGRSTTRAIHSFDDFIWTRERSALAIMRYCLPFDSVATARAALRQRERDKDSPRYTVSTTRGPWNISHHAYSNANVTCWKVTASLLVKTGSRRNNNHLYDFSLYSAPCYDTARSLWHGREVVVKSFLYSPVSLIVRL